MSRGIRSIESVRTASPLAPPAPDRCTAAELVARVAAGDDVALGTLYDAYAALLYTVALRIVGAPADADEVVLETFTQAWRDAARFDPARGAALAWLVTICRTRALDLVRARVREMRARDRAARVGTATDAPPALAAWRPDPVAELDRHDRHERLAAAVRALPPAVRRVVELVLTDALTHTELAERLGLPLGTVKTRMRTGLRLLRDALGAQPID